MISYKYIAGFFDGEGTITIRKNGVVISMVQSIGPHQVIQKIYAFLKYNGIESVIDFRKGAKSWYRDQEVLRITNRRNQEKFLKRTISHLVVKRKLAEKALEKFHTYQAENADKNTLEIARQYYWNYKVTVKDAAKKHRLGYYALRGYMRRLNEPARSMSEATTLWHRNMSKRKRSKLMSSLKKVARKKKGVKLSENHKKNISCSLLKFHANARLNHPRKNTSLSAND